jgi:hypothetical protein
MLVLISSIVVAQTVTKQNQKIKDNFGKMTFEVELNKNKYVLLEPIYIKFKFSNQTKNPQPTYSPVFIQESKLRVSSDGEVVEFNQLSSITNKPFRLNRIFQPGEVLISNEVISSAFAGVFFPKPGNYQIQFVLSSSDGNKTIESNTIDIVIEEPTGINKEAYDFMIRHNEYFGMSSWNNGGPAEISLLEKFVNKYDESSYGEIAISNLGYLYLNQGELDKAQVEFEKLKFSNSKLLAEEAKSALVEIEKKKVSLKELKSPQ